MTAIGITAVRGIKAGHYTDARSATGCTVVLCEGGAVGGVDVRGSAPGTRETDLLRPTFTVRQVHGVLLSGGSTFGLDAASGVVRFLEERGVGVEFGGSRIPIVPAAILFDLGLVTGKVRPGPAEGYGACESSGSGPVEEGSVGAGTGATVAKLLGIDRAVKGGIGTASTTLDGEVTVGAMVAVNAIGGVFDYETGRLVAGPRTERGMADSLDLILSPGYRRPGTAAPTNTTIGVVATDASLDKEQANKLASVAHDGIALAVRPAHLMNDGDTMFALATGASGKTADMNRLCAATVVCVARAIVRAVETATSLGGVPAVSEIHR